MNNIVTDFWAFALQTVSLLKLWFNVFIDEIQQDMLTYALLKYY